MRCGLRAVDDEVTTLLVDATSQLNDGIFHAKHIGDMHDGENLRLRPDFLVHLFRLDDAVLVGIEVDELRACIAARLLPGDEVGMVLHDGDAHFIARLKHGGGEGLRNDVERLGCVAREHDVVPVGRADELGDAMACHLDRLGGLDRQAV